MYILNHRFQLQQRFPVYEESIAIPKLRKLSHFNDSLHAERRYVFYVKRFFVLISKIHSSKDYFDTGCGGFVYLNVKFSNIFVIIKYRKQYSSGNKILSPDSFFFYSKPFQWINKVITQVVQFFCMIDFPLRRISLQNPIDS